MSRAEAEAVSTRLRNTPFSEVATKIDEPRPLAGEVAGRGPASRIGRCLECRLRDQPQNTDFDENWRCRCRFLLGGPSPARQGPAPLAQETPERAPVQEQAPEAPMSPEVRRLWGRCGPEFGATPATTLRRAPADQLLRKKRDSSALHPLRNCGRGSAPLSSCRDFFFVPAKRQGLMDAAVMCIASPTHRKGAPTLCSLPFATP